MKLTYFSVTLFLLTTHISKTMLVDFSTSITFNGKEKSLYEWIRYDHDKEFGYTPIINLHNKYGDEPDDHYYKDNHVNSIKIEQLAGIAAGFYIYCKDIKIKNLSFGEKINYGVLALAFNKTTVITPESINLKANLLQADYLKKLFFKKKKDSKSDQKS